jgi:hypothetical protein
MDPLSIALMGGGTLAGNLLKGFGGQQASSIQAGGAQNAALWQALAAGQAQQNYAQYFNQAKEALNPYVQAGQKSMDTLQSYLTGNNAKTAGIGGGGDTLMSTFQPTQEQLESTPGYQWARKQALGAMTNSAAAKGLGTSGNLVQGIGETATGLASQTFQQQLQNYLAQNQQAYNMLMGPTQIGATAAGNLGQAAIQTGQLTGNAMLGAGTAMGQGTMGAANAQAQGVNALYGGISSGIQGAAAIPFMAQMYGQNAGTGAGANNYSSAAFGLPAAIFGAAGYKGPLEFGNALSGSSGMGYGPQMTASGSAY